MRLGVPVGLGLALALAAAGLPAGGATAAGHPKSASGHAYLLVYAQEWSLWPSTRSVPAGTVGVELWNRGEDMHDLRIRRLNSQGQMVGPIDGTVRVTPSGGISHAVWHLTAGRYEIYCSLPGHLAMGMHTNIAVHRS